MSHTLRRKARPSDADKYVATALASTSLLALGLAVASGYLPVRRFHVELCIVLLLGFAAVGLWRLGRNRMLVAASATVLAGLLVLLGPLQWRLSAGLVRRDSVESADAVYVPVPAASRVLTDESRSQLLHAVDLLGRGRAERLVIGEREPSRPVFSLLARSLLRQRGLAVPVLVVGLRDDSRVHAANVAALCRDRGWSRLILVAPPLQSGSTARALEQAGLGVISSPGPLTASGPLARLSVLDEIVHETIGL